mgnify:CR=1 FL=1
MPASFGPAGNSESFTKMGYKSSLQVPEYIVKMGLDAFEYQCGRGVNIGTDKAAALGKLAAEKGMDHVLANIYSFNKQSQHMFEAAGFYKISEEWYQYDL